MTEEEAKTKWCPFVRYAEMQEDGINRETNENNPAYARCIASQCMAWRWAQKPNPEYKVHHDMMFPPRDTRFDQPAYIRDETRGYCGMAGRPE